MLSLADLKPLQQHSRSTEMRRSEYMVKVSERWNEEYSLHLFSPRGGMSQECTTFYKRLACPHDSRQEQPAICNCNELAKMLDPLCSHPHGYYVHQGKSLISPSSNLKHQCKLWQHPPGVRCGPTSLNLACIVLFLCLISIIIHKYIIILLLI